MSKKDFLKKKNIIIFLSILIVFIIIIGIVIFLSKNTIIFKSSDEVKKDLIDIKENIENSIYSDYVGVSNGTPYIKENASEKIKDAAKDTEYGFEKTVKSENGLLIIEPYAGTNAIECKVISNTKDNINITAYSAQNLCDVNYELGTIKDKKIVEEGNDNLTKVKVMSNTTYTITNNVYTGINTVFFLDNDSKYISSTTENTFTTPNNAKYIKVITEAENAWDTNIKYNLVLGTEAGYVFDALKTEVSIDLKSEQKTYIPLDSEKMVLNIDGGEIEISYVSK